MNTYGFIKSILLTVAAFLWQSVAVAQLTVHQSEAGLQYLKYLPKGYEEAGQQSFPVLLFLHGGGEVGSDIELVKRHGPPKLIGQGREFPFILIAPQNPDDRLWDDVALKKLLDEVMASHRVDRNRVYLSGMSRGGFGAWRMAIQYPDLFAAVIPICGGGTPDYVDRIKAVPVWVFHGAKDQTIPLSRSVEMVEALQKVRGNVKLTVYPDAGHDSWTLTYNNPAVFDWLLAQQKPAPASQTK